MSAIQPVPIALLNAPVLTVMGWFSMHPLALDEAQALIRRQGFISAIGHTATANVLSELLQIHCPVARIDFNQMPGQSALVLRLARRLPEGQVLHTRDEIEAWGYSMALLTRLHVQPQICGAAADL